VIDKVSIRVFWAICATNNYHIEQVDVKTAFLYGECVQEVYVTLPKELQTDDEKGNNLVRKMQKSLYGTSDAPKIWYKTIAKFLEEIGFQKCGREHCLFSNSTTKVLLMIYVDDLAVAGPTKSQTDDVVVQLKQRFSMREMGNPSVFLGINVHHFPRERIIFVNQRTYIQKLLEKYELSQQFSKATPASTTRLEQLQPGEEITTRPYRSLVGELLYISVCTRPDIAFAVGMLSKFLDKAGDTHWAAAVRVLLYLKGTSSYGLPLGGKESAGNLLAYVDADYANDTTDYKSITGYLVFFGKSLISWTSKKQKNVTLSTTEAEFIALTDVARELLWVQPIYQFLGFPEIKKYTIILEDNLPVINLALNQQTKGRTKHLNVKVKFIAELIEEQVFKIEKVSSADNIADLMTKSQGKVLFLRQRQQFMVELQALNHCLN
jgi:hypothetical protein